MVKWYHPRVFGKIKVNVLLSENIANLGIFSKLVNNIKNNKIFYNRYILIRLFCDVVEAINPDGNQISRPGKAWSGFGILVVLNWEFT